MKTKILDALKIKYKNLGFSDKAFEGVADYLATTVTEEDQIDNSIAGVEIVLKGLQGDIDSRVNSAVAKAKAESSKQKPTEKKEESKPDPDDVPEWAKSLLDSNKALQEKINALETGKTLESRRSRLEHKLKDTPEKMKASYIKRFDRMTFKDEDDFNEYVAEVEAEVKDLVQDFSNNGLKTFGAPSGGGGNNSKKPATKEETKEVADRLMSN